MFVKVKGIKKRKEILDFLESNGYILDNEWACGRDDIINERFPISINMNKKTYRMMGNTTTAAAAASSGSLIEVEEFYKRFERINN